MSSRVTLTDPAEMTTEQRALYDRFESNLTRSLLLTKGSAIPHLTLGASFTTGLLSLLTREVVVLRVAHLRESAFEKQLHYPLAAKAGLSDEEIAAIENADTDKLDPERAAIVAYVTDCIVSRKASDESFGRLREFFSQNEIAEITHLTGHSDMTAMYLECLQIPLDERLPSWESATAAAE